MVKEVVLQYRLERDLVWIKANAGKLLNLSVNVEARQRALECLARFGQRIRRNGPAAQQDVLDPARVRRSGLVGLFRHG